jgi:hypothetical protein
MSFHYAFLRFQMFVILPAWVAPIVAADSPICNRTPQVRAAIFAALRSPCRAGNCPCQSVTEKDLVRVRSLSLAGTGLTTLKDGDFSGLTALEKLDLAKNRLEQLPEKIFEDLAALRELRLESNRFAQFPYSSVATLGKLRVLGTDIAPLRDMPDRIFDTFTSRADFEFKVAYRPKACKPFSHLPEDNLQPAVPMATVASLLQRPDPPSLQMESFQAVHLGLPAIPWIAAFDLSDSPTSPRMNTMDICALRLDISNKFELIGRLEPQLLTVRELQQYLGYSLQTTPYRLDDTESAFAVIRTFQGTAHRGTAYIWEDATFLRLNGSAIKPVLSTKLFEYTESSISTGYGSTEISGTNVCSALIVAQSKTLGHFNWIQINNAPDATVTIYRWNGKEYQNSGN